MKTAVVTDSTAYIPAELREKYDIHMVPLSVIFGKEIYKEELEITADDFYDMVKRLNMLPTTTQPPIGEFVELFEQLSQEYDSVISIHLSSGISGTFQGAVSAGEMVDQIHLYSFDTEVSSMVQGLYVIEAAKMAQQGKHPNVIMARLEDLKQSSQAYFMVDDLSNLQRSGRLSGAQALIGSLLQVKPLLHFSDKVIVPFEKIRTRKKAIKRLEELLGNAVRNGEPLQAVVIHGNCQQEGIQWKKELEEKFPEVDFSFSYFGAVLGTHLGEGSLGLGWMKK